MSGACRAVPALSLLWVVACAEGPEAVVGQDDVDGQDEIVAPTQPEGWDDGIALPLAEDLNPDPNVLEVNLEARQAEIEILPGVMTRLWTYNGLLPGPLLRAQRGDRIIVHFKNNLPQPTTVHWHGVHVPANMDGTAAAQDPVQPGETFTYDFVVPVAGTYWYHPHVDSSSQLGYGLHGALVVDDPDDPVAVDEVVLVFSDLSLDREGQLQPGDHNEWFGDYFGREGALVLINGKVRPRLLAAAGLPQRWRVINATRARYFQMAIPEIPLVRIGGDAGLIEHPLAIDQLVLSPSERGEVIVVPPESGQGEVDVMLEDADRFNIGILAPSEPLFQLEVVSAGPMPPFELPAQLRSFPELDLTVAKPRRIEFGETVVDGVVHLTIDGHVHGESSQSASGDPAHDHGPAYVAFVGDTETWEIVNTTEYEHPFHLHGFSFEVLERGGAAWPVREWKDTVNVPANKSVRFVVSFDDRPGMWMFHCHILDHVSLGMMAALEVRRP